MKDLFNISGQAAVVTGGSSGIGFMIARGLVENGVKTYITARKVEQLNAAAEALSEYGECIAIPADLSGLTGIEHFAAAVLEQEPKIDILINNAGANWAAPYEEFPESGWDKVMDINIKSVFFVTQKLLPGLRAAGSEADPARVVNIASIHGVVNPQFPTYAYSASKGGLIHLTKHMGADLAPMHINVNGIAPGFFPSKMTASLMEEEEKVVGQQPIPRTGRPEDIAGTAIYLCAPASNYMCGHTVVLDGGLVAGS